MQKASDEARGNGMTLGFVPTMGSLHEGHLSLVDIANRFTDMTVVSIFVNPKQFGPGEDLKKYPKNVERDKRLLRQRGCSVVFVPDAKEMFNKNFKSEVYVRDLSRLLCGITRKTHFKGVTTVVAKLFNIVKPHISVFGQKDAQQAAIIRRMVKELNFDIKILTGPTIRERDGLAMSSRNAYLSNLERIEATVIYRSLREAEQMIRKGERRTRKILTRMKKMIQEKKKAKIDYVKAVEMKTLKPVEEVRGEVLFAVACYFGRTRLIDNTIIRVRI